MRCMRCWIAPLLGLLLAPLKSPAFILYSTNVWRSTGKRSSCCTTTSSGMETCNVHNTKLQQLSDALSSEERDMANKLLQLGQSHLMDEWPPAGEQDEDKQRFLRQALNFDRRYPGGLEAYLSKAKTLMKQSANGDNPYEGYKPKVPNGQSVMYGSPEFDAAETQGLKVAAKTAFILVAGGLGERLGYRGIKLALPVEASTGMRYLELYVKYILALQDTDAPTRCLLEENGNFGMSQTQIKFIRQEKVPALANSNAQLALSSNDHFSLEMKPHGHGDVHYLLLRDGIVDSLLSQGFEYIFFLQDTNALVVHSILPALGVSYSQKYHMNSICVPRSAKEATGALVSLEANDGSRNLVINVEYNQLDPLLKATVNRDGDVNDPDTGYSPFPGNINAIVMELQSYAKVLKGKDKGVVMEFVNPKYEDETHTSFKKPTRLECMMQDFPLLMERELGSLARIGFTGLEKWLTYSPAKYSVQGGMALANAGLPPSTLGSAEADFYNAHAMRLTKASDATLGKQEDVNFGGISFKLGPRIILGPEFALTTSDIRHKINRNVKITSRSTLIVYGAGVILDSLDLDGSLYIYACKGATLTIRGLVINSKGWTFKSVSPTDVNVTEEDRIRGYIQKKEENASICVSRPGNYIVDASGVVTEV
eukprot:71612_1